MSDTIIQPIGGAARHFLRRARHCRGVAFVACRQDRIHARICQDAGYLQPSALSPATILHITDKGSAYLDRLARCE